MAVFSSVNKIFSQNLKHANAEKLHENQDDGKTNELANRAQQQQASDKADIRLSLAGYYLVIFFGKEKRSTERLSKERQEHPVLTYNNAPILAFVWLSVVFTLYSITAVGVRSLSMLVS